MQYHDSAARVSPQDNLVAVVRKNANEEVHVALNEFKVDVISVRTFSTATLKGICPKVERSDHTLLADPLIRRLVHVCRISPVLAGVYAELLSWGGRHA